MSLRHNNKLSYRPKKKECFSNYSSGMGLDKHTSHPIVPSRGLQCRRLFGLGLVSKLVRTAMLLLALITHQMSLGITHDESNFRSAVIGLRSSLQEYNRVNFATEVVLALANHALKSNQPELVWRFVDRFEENFRLHEESEATRNCTSDALDTLSFTLSENTAALGGNVLHEHSDDVKLIVSSLILQMMLRMQTMRSSAFQKMAEDSVVGKDSIDKIAGSDAQHETGCCLLLVKGTTITDLRN